MKVQIRSFRLVALLMSALLLSGCAETQLASTWAKQVTWPGQAESRSTYKVGNPYKVGSVWYYPEENFTLVETGITSWYGPGFHKDHTANGEVFDQNELTAAHRTLQLPCLARITNLENGHSVVVRINDRGPFLHGRIMDVSMRAAELLGFANRGTARVRLEVLEKESRILAAAAKSGQDTSRMTLADLQQQGAGQVVAAAPAPARPVAATGASRPEYISGASAPGASRPEYAPAPPVRIASAAHAAPAGGEDAAMPESLRTPTITVEELTAPGSHATVPPPKSGAKAPDIYSGREASSAHSSYQPPAYQPPLPSAPESGPMVQGHLHSGKFIPDPVVSDVPVRPTGIFVQAGSFSVFANAEKLTKRLATIAPTTIEPVTVNGRKLYRVKLGPIASVTEADSILEKVIRTSGSGAKVIKD